jgi:hypothetical protein
VAEKAAKPTLSLVPRHQPDARDETILRVKKMPRPDGMLQCPRCGCREVLNTQAGVIITKGRRKPGTKIAIDECAQCWKAGLHVSMLPAGPKPAT